VTATRNGAAFVIAETKSIVSIATFGRGFVQLYLKRLIPLLVCDPCQAISASVGLSVALLTHQSMSDRW
jgi:hypothetical protein